MAKVTITVEDTERGTVRVVPTPSCREMARIVSRGQDPTPAHEYALEMIKVAMKIAKAADDQEGTNKIIAPNDFNGLY